MARRYYALAAALFALGVLGFLLPGPLFGFFDVTPASNAIHLGAGVLTALAARRGLGTMRSWGQMLGYLFAGLTIAAVATDGSSVANLLPLTNSNAWFHLALSLVFLYHALLAPPTL